LHATLADLTIDHAGVGAHSPVSDTTFGKERAPMSDQHDHPTPAKILETGLAFWASKTLLSAVEMGIFTELASGPRGFEELRGRLGLHARSARDFFDALCALGFLQKTNDS